MLNQDLDYEKEDKELMNALPDEANVVEGMGVYEFYLARKTCQKLLNFKKKWLEKQDEEKDEKNRQLQEDGDGESSYRQGDADASERASVIGGQIRTSQSPSLLDERSRSPINLTKK